MKVRGGLAALVSLLCFMLLVIVGGRGSTTNSAELASSESLTVGASDTHTHDEADGHTHAEGTEDHEHADGEEHEHADGTEGHSHADGTTAAHGHADGTTDAHEHADGTTTDGHTHPDGTTDPGTTDPTHCHTNCDPTVPTDPTHEHPTPPTPLYTQTQLDLLTATQAWISPRFDNVNAARAAGYVSIGDASTGYEHYVNNAFLSAPDVLNPSTIESLVYQVNGSTRTLVSGMYILPLGQSLTNVPAAFNSPQTPWHIHSNLCWGVSPLRVVGTTSTGQAGCPAGSVYFVTPPMLHTWLQEQTCGWFADLEQVGGDCSSHPH